ncbi:hypothetical protein [Humidesulfovibrio mexicanus]|uniref:hypothetical protein n=1 Tax=Humidesulfovibrio mexicanus TaxID=147047 RepID=UPI001178C67D
MAVISVCSTLWSALPLSRVDCQTTLEPDFFSWLYTLEVSVSRAISPVADSSRTEPPLSSLEALRVTPPSVRLFFSLFSFQRTKGPAGPGRSETTSTKHCNIN